MAAKAAYLPKNHYLYTMLFHPLTTGVQPPAAMNDPFDYVPHLLCRLAAAELQARLPQLMAAHPAERGKMFGVLVVERGHELGYLQAYSGQIEGGYPYGDDFVPPVYDYLSPTGYFRRHEADISALNRRIGALEGGLSAANRVGVIERLRQSALERWRERMATAKAERDRRKPSASDDELRAMIRQSQYQKAQLRRIRLRWNLVVEAVGRRAEAASALVKSLKQQRKEQSEALQEWLFSRFEMRNGRGEAMNIKDIFSRYDPLRPYLQPPGGTGECCEPKLLQYAYLHGLRPRCMAMFWWGDSPDGEVRRHLDYYPACQGKCRPVLQWMLRGVEVERMVKKEVAEGLKTVYDDEWIAVVCKPSGMLSVPGRAGEESVSAIVSRRYPAAMGPMMVHRLDMDTSGLMVIAKTLDVYRDLQRQFATHAIRKRYVALLESPLPSGKPRKGRIDLPLSKDIDDRPRQKVDRQHGKKAVTEYEMVAENRVVLVPHTGRTHQLRVHCAHPDGLGCPILGDNLYGHKGQRLHLHAERLEFVHPITKKAVAFAVPPDF